MGSCAAPSAKGDDKFITTDYLQQCPNINYFLYEKIVSLFIIFKLSILKDSATTKIFNIYQDMIDE